MKPRKERVYFCKLCGYVATSLEDLDLHYKISHEDFGDSIEDDVW